MLKRVVFSLFFVCAVVATPAMSVVSAPASSGTVYICTGNSSECYHIRRNCRGLNACKASIREVSYEKAKSMRRCPCGWCCK